MGQRRPALGGMSGDGRRRPCWWSWPPAGPAATAGEALAPVDPRRGGPRPAVQRRPGRRVLGRGAGGRTVDRTGHPLPRGRTWPAAVDVRFAVQAAPLGTVDAVARRHAPPGPRCTLRGRQRRRPLPVERADPPGRPPPAGPGHPGPGGLLAGRAVLGDGPVTRGVCETDGQGCCARSSSAAR